jgi:hypothetical protein
MRTDVRVGSSSEIVALAIDIRFEEAQRRLAAILAADVLAIPA